MTAEDRELKDRTLEDIHIWLALLALLGLTYGVSFTHWGAWKTVLSFVISAAKTLLIAWSYMHLRRENGLTRLFAITGAAWLIILMALTLSDYVSRGWLPYPSRWPIPADPRPAEHEDQGPRQTQPPHPDDHLPIPLQR